MKKVLLWLWQLPQNLAGWCISRNSNVLQSYFGNLYFKNFYRSGVSLGSYIILDNCYRNSTLLYTTAKHEHGHQKQSLYLGPLYLLVIGLPSFIGNIYARIAHKSSGWYYAQPWEAWADRLGGVER